MWGHTAQIELFYIPENHQPNPPFPTVTIFSKCIFLSPSFPTLVIIQEKAFLGTAQAPQDRAVLRSPIIFSCPTHVFVLIWLLMFILSFNRLYSPERPLLFPLCNPQLPCSAIRWTNSHHGKSSIKSLQRFRHKWRFLCDVVFRHLSLIFLICLNALT